MNSKQSKQRTTQPLEFELPGTPEQVWQAIATGPGISSWLFSARVEEQEGGAVLFQIGPGMESSGTVTGWEPPRRFAYEEANWAEGAPPLGTEFVIEARGGGTCRVRLVHSLFASSDQWDDELGGFEAGWRGFFRVLRVYLTHFTGQHAAPLRVMGRFAGNEVEAWATLRAKLGLSDAAAGQRWSTEGTGAPRSSGRIHSLGDTQGLKELIAILDEPAPAIALFGVASWAGQVHVALSCYVFGEQAEAARTKLEQRWAEWLGKHFP